MTALAIHLKTESGDDYLFCYDLTEKSDVKYVVNAVSEILDEEMGYVYDYNVCLSQDDEKLVELAEKLISEAIEYSQNS